MAYSVITRIASATALALALAACAAGPPKNTSALPAATAHGDAAHQDSSGWRAQQQALEDQLRIRLAGTDATVSSVREGLRVRVPAHVVFVTDSTGIRPEASYLLGELTQVLKDVPSARLTVLVYSDALDDSASTRAFTAARALAVEGLLQQQGVPGARLQAQGGGQAEPLGGNETPEQRQANRRLEILISPLSF